MRTLITVVFLLIVNSSFAQDLQALEEQMKTFERGEKFDSADFPARIKLTYQIGALYYKRFIDGSIMKADKAGLTADANKATTYFTELANLDPARKEELKYPLIQLSEYLGHQAKSREYRDWHNPAAYFSVSAFLRLPDNWENTYSVNVLSHTRDRSLKGVESALFSIKWYSKHLAAMQEPVMRSYAPGAAYRITYLRTFHQPIVMRIENKEGKITLFWKVTDGKGGYEPGNIIQNGSKELTPAEWQKLENRVQSIGFWPTSPTDPGVDPENPRLEVLDGSKWIMEGKNAEKYHVVDRSESPSIRELFKTLLPLTDIQIPKQEMY